MVTEELHIGNTVLIVTKAYCCREWTVLAYVRLGRCGYCGQRPVIL